MIAEAEFEQFVSDSRPHLVSIAMSELNLAHVDQAEDIVQTILLSIWARRESLTVRSLIAYARMAIRRQSWHENQRSRTDESLELKASQAPIDAADPLTILLEQERSESAKANRLAILANATKFMRAECLRWIEQGYPRPTTNTIRCRNSRVRAAVARLAGASPTHRYMNVSA